MGRSNVDDIMGSVREGLAGVGEKGQDIAEDVAERVEEALNRAGKEGRKIRKELARRWQVVDRAGRENAFAMALGALGVGIIVGFLISRSDD
jgi:ElaB/YqjD/DUF883 family membrane-anchored ribosome-binding protein